MNTYLDPLLSSKNVEVQPEPLIDPEPEPPVGKPINPRSLRYRLSHYGNRALASIGKFLAATIEAFQNIGTALAGSIILLPLVIMARGISVLAKGLINFGKPLMLSIIRLFFETLHAVIAPIRSVFGNFNKYVLFPMLKRIREDDIAAGIAFVVLLALMGGVVYALLQVL